jgi:hypothetical protein
LPIASEANAYYDAFVNDEELLDGIDESKINTCTITQANFAKLFMKKDLAGYLNFFDNMYQ